MRGIYALYSIRVLWETMHLCSYGDKCSQKFLNTVGLKAFIARAIVLAIKKLEKYSRLREVKEYVGRDPLFHCIHPRWRHVQRHKKSCQRSICLTVLNLYTAWESNEWKRVYIVFLSRFSRPCFENIVILLIKRTLP